jgi:hypothetical protein
MPDEPTRLTWIPMGSPRLRPPAGLKDFQEAWWWRLFWAMFDHGEPQGYLAVTADIYLLSGSRNRQRWDAHAVCLLNAFETSNVAGQQVVFFPPLIDALAAQRKKLRARGLPRANENRLSLSQSVFDFDLKKGQEKILCPLHPESGRTQWGTCWECYAEKYG